MMISSAISTLQFWEKNDWKDEIFLYAVNLNLWRLIYFWVLLLLGIGGSDLS